MHVHVTSPNRDKRRTALRFVISLPFPHEKCNARSLFKEREREREIKNGRQVVQTLQRSVCKVLSFYRRPMNISSLRNFLHPGTERQLNSSCILATALLWGNGSRGTGGRVWSGYCWKRTAVFVFPSSPNKASFSRSLLRREIRDVHVRFRSFQDPFDRGPCCWSLVGCFFGRREIYEI